MAVPVEAGCRSRRSTRWVPIRRGLTVLVRSPPISAENDLWRGCLVMTPTNHPARHRLVRLLLDPDMTVDVGRSDREGRHGRVEPRREPGGDKVHRTTTTRPITGPIIMAATMKPHPNVTSADGDERATSSGSRSGAPSPNTSRRAERDLTRSRRPTSAFPSRSSDLTRTGARSADRLVRRRVLRGTQGSGLGRLPTSTPSSSRHDRFAATDPVRRHGSHDTPRTAIAGVEGWPAAVGWFSRGTWRASAAAGRRDVVPACGWCPAGPPAASPESAPA